MKVIHIYGASGSGTTTLGEAIFLKYGFAHLDTDNYFWLPSNPPYMYKRETSDRLALMKKDIEKNDNVVISGSLCGWGDILIPFFTLAIRIVTPTAVRINRLEAREYRNFGDRIRMNGDMYDEHISFIKWAKEYDSGDKNMRSIAMHNEWSKLIPCEQVIIDGTKSVDDIMELLKFYLEC